MFAKLNNISTKAIQKATGKSWDEWVGVIDKEGGADLSHKEIAKMLSEKGYIKSSWWCQQVTVGYEYAKDRRILGQTKTAGFEIGAQKTLPVSQKQAWELITSPVGWKIWLGDVDNFKPVKGFTYGTKEGTKGEVRSVDPDTKIRLTFHPKFLKKPSTLQIYLLCPRNTPEKTNFRFHQEKLSSAAEREKMGIHWQQILNKIEKLI